ncbi:MAG: enoyl-CoA hydratase/isomerase family protein [Candidatus Dormibacteraceae bacterium]
MKTQETATQSETEEADELLTHRQGPVRWITFNRPRARNAMTWHMYDRLVEVCREVNEDPSVRAVVLTGASGRGPAFVAGTDIGQFRSFETAEDALRYEESGANVMRTLEEVKVPTIAAIAGPCTGGGAMLAACCDLRLGSPSARMGFPIARTLGNCLSVVNYTRLVDLIGAARVKDLIFRARLIGAEEMLSLGLITELVPDEESLLPRAQEWGEQIADLAPLTLQVTKEALLRIRDGRAPQGSDSDLVLRCYLSEDFKEGMDAFLQKRKPNWQGR